MESDFPEIFQDSNTSWESFYARPNLELNIYKSVINFLWIRKYEKY